MTCSRRSASAAGDIGAWSSRPLMSGASEKYDSTAPYPGEEQLLRVVATQAAGVHLALQELGAAVEQRLEQRRELTLEHRAAFERFAAREANEVGVLLEERERGPQHLLDLTPTLAWPAGRLLDEIGPVGEGVDQHLAVERVLRREVVQQARPADPDLVRDVVQARSREAAFGEAGTGDGEDVLLRGRSRRREHHGCRLCVRLAAASRTVGPAGSYLPVCRE